jgi:hypothetical protein
MLYTKTRQAYEDMATHTLHGTNTPLYASLSPRLWLFPAQKCSRRRLFLCGLGEASQALILLNRVILTIERKSLTNNTPYNLNFL